MTKFHRHSWDLRIWQNWDLDRFQAQNSDNYHASFRLKKNIRNFCDWFVIL